MMDAQLLQKTREQHAAGQLEEARQGYLQLLAEQPDSGELCYLLGLLHFSQQQHDEAEHYFLRTVELAPQAGPAYYNLGTLALERHAHEEAISFFRQAQELMPEDIDTLFNLGLTLKKAGHLEQARLAYLQVLHLDAHDIETLYNLAVLHQEGKEETQAINYLEQVILLKNDHCQALNNLGYLYHRTAQFDRARETYQRLIDLDYNSSTARHMLNALSGETSATAPADYVRDVFDQFSDHYEESLVEKLGYHTPELLLEMVNNHLPQHHFKKALDMGCGTGLSGQAFAASCGQLIGLDLSSKMLAQAQAKGIYHSLHQADIATFFHGSTESYDLFLAADVFVYLDELTEVFSQVASHAQPGALFAFSCEASSAPTYELKESGRYGHQPDYILKLAKEQGFQSCQLKEAPIRKEEGKWLQGTLFLLQKRSERPEQGVTLP